MGTQPETQYVKSGDAHIAYQVVGEGSVDLAVVRGYISHVETAWESPALAAFYRRLQPFCRLILFDKRGTGLSDRVPETQLPTLEQRMDDVRAVLDAAGSERTAFFASSEGGPMCLLFAATYPERTAGLILWGCFAKYDWRRSFIGRYWGDTVEGALARLEREWGDGRDLAAMAPSLAEDEEARRSWGRAQRLAATPGAARALLRMMLDIDVRPMLGSIRVPTLILQRAEDVAVDPSHSRFMATRIRGAKYVELPGADHLFWVGDVEPVVAEMREFLTGTRQPREPDVVVVTAMSVEIVSPPEEKDELGPAKVERFKEIVRTHVAGFRGRQLEGTDAGYSAIFDGPGRAIRSARSIIHDAANSGLTGRAGLHTGECETQAEEVRGIALQMAGDILALGAPGEVMMSRTVVDLVAGSGLQFTDRGIHRVRAAPGLWQLFALSTSDPPNGQPPSLGETEMLFRREGDYWMVAYAGKVVRVRDAKGLRYLARLLESPHREFHVLDLVGGERTAVREDDPRVSHRSAMGDAGAILDERAKDAYRRRITDLREEVEEARAWHDSERVSRAEDELNALVHQLASAVGLGGRDRKMASNSERARFSVSKALRTALKRITAEHPELGRHLRSTVRTGSFCVYEPDSRLPGTWTM